MNSEKVNVSTVGFKCNKCNMVYTNQYDADLCCTKKFCKICGKEIPNYYYSDECNLCSLAKRIANAKKMTLEEYKKTRPDNAVVFYFNGAFYDKIEFILAQFENKDLLPKWVWGTELKYLKLNPQSILDDEIIRIKEENESFTDVGFSKEAKEEFIEFIERWNEEHKTEYYAVDESTLVLIPEEILKKYQLNK